MNTSDILNSRKTRGDFEGFHGDNTVQFLNIFFNMIIWGINIIVVSALKRIVSGT